MSEGAGGTVFKAVHVPTLRVVAVKCVKIYELSQRRQQVELANARLALALRSWRVQKHALPHGLRVLRIPSCCL